MLLLLAIIAMGTMILYGVFGKRRKQCPNCGGKNFRYGYTKHGMDKIRDIYICYDCGYQQSNIINR